MIRIFSLSMGFFVSQVFLGAQNENIQGSSYGVGEKPVSEYYSSVDKKSSYQKHKIRNLKGELNNYSGRLHNLQKRFDEIFYGLSSDNKHSKPFDLENSDSKRNIPPKKFWYEANASAFITPKNQNLGTIQSNQEFQPNKNSQNPSPASNEYDLQPQIKKTFGQYLIISPGVSFPFKQHEVNDGSTTSLRKYVTGFTTNLAMGFEKGSYRIGLGGMYRQNSHDGESYFNSDQLSEDSFSLAGYLDLGFKTSLNESLDAYFGVGLGYLHTRSKIPTKLEDDGFYGTGSLGLSWNLSEVFAFRLGYRYMHDIEVPSHVGEVGFNFAF